MRVYDISQEVFGCVVFANDPEPKREVLTTIKQGSVCNLTAFSMCAHNGTHVDAPYHFIDDGKKVDELSLESLVGYAYVAEHCGIITAEDIDYILERAEAAMPESAKRILIKGDATLSNEAAVVLKEHGVLLFGNESQTVGPENAPAEVHRTLLGADVVLLEGIRLDEVEEGAYILCAAPINLGGADGAPCRAILIEQ
jgi:arylformamidase